MSRRASWMLDAGAAIHLVWSLWPRDGGMPADTPRLVLLYATSTRNADPLSPYDPDDAFTPQLADFARSSVVFSRHQTESGQSRKRPGAVDARLPARTRGAARPLDPTRAGPRSGAL
jgi:hypothetical protein